MIASVLHQKIQTSVLGRFDLPIAWREKPARELIPSGIPKIDVARGTLTEIAGPPSSGRKSILTGVLARATRRPEFCALIDASNSFDPTAANDLGVQLPFLLWLRCGGSAEKALKAADLVVQAGGFGVVAMDLTGVSPREARRISLASWFRLRHAVEKTPTALIVIAQNFNAGSCSTLQISTRRVGVERSGNLLRGLTINADIGPRQKSKASFTLTSLYRM